LQPEEVALIHVGAVSGRRVALVLLSLDLLVDCSQLPKVTVVALVPERNIVLFPRFDGRRDGTNAHGVTKLSYLQ
jgi:hypothetical protein